SFFIPVHRPPGSHMPMPGERHLGKHVDASTHVLGTLGVMSGSCENFVRPSLCYVLHLAMKLFRSDAEAKWIPANFVKRDQAVVTVEASIFECFRQQGTGVHACCRVGRANKARRNNAKYPAQRDRGRARRLARM